MKREWNDMDYYMNLPSNMSKRRHIVWKRKIESLLPRIIDALRTLPLDQAIAYCDLTYDELDRLISFGVFTDEELENWYDEKLKR